MKLKSLILFILLSISNVFAAEIPKEPVKIGYIDFMPFYHKGPDNQIRGILVDYWNLWSEKTGTPVSFYIMSFAEMQDRIKKGEIDIIAAMFYSEQRDKFLDFSRPYYRGQGHIFSHVSAFPAEKIEDLANKEVGLISKTFPVSFIKKYQADAIIYEYPDLESLISDAVKGKIKYFVYSTPVVKTYLAKNNLFKLFTPADSSLFANPFQAAVLEGNTDLLTSLNQGISLISKKEMNSIVGNWTGETIEPVYTSVFDKYKELSVVYPKENPPFYYTDEQGNAKGLYIDLWKLWSKKTGIKINFISAAWKQSLEMMQDGFADIHVGLFQNRARDAYLDYVTKIGHSDVCFFFHKSIFGLKNLNDLQGFKIGVVKGSYVEKEIPKLLPDVVLVTYPSITVLLDAAAAGEIKVFIKSVSSTLWWMKKKSLTDEFSFHARHPLFSNNHYAAVQEGNDELAEIISQGMELISPEEHVSIDEKWNEQIHTVYSKYKNIIHLKIKEKAWLKEHENIRLGCTTDWPPMEFHDDTGTYKGIFADYLNIINKRLNINIEPVFLPWPEVIKQAKQGKIDMFTGRENTERKSFMNFTQAFLSNSLVIINRIETPFIEGIRNLRGKKAAVIKDFAIHKQLALDFPDIELIPANNALECLLKVSKGKADAYIGDLIVASHLIQKNQIRNLKIASPTGYKEYKIRYAVRKDWPIFVNILNKVIDSISIEEHNEIRRKWVAIHYDQKLDWKIIRQWVFIIVLVFTIITAVILLWNRRLSKEIDERKQVQEKLTFEQNRLFSVLEAIPGFVYLQAPDYSIRYANKTFISLFGDPKGKPCYKVIKGRSEPCVPCTTFKAFKTKSVNEWEWENKSNGRTYMIYDNFLPDADGSGLVLELGIDITDRKNMESLMIQTEKMMSVGGLAAGMAHEINNPLAGILQNLQVIQSRLTKDLAKNRETAQACGVSLDGIRAYMEKRGLFKMMDSVNKSGIRAAKIVENMLSFSRRSESRFAPHDIGRLLDSSVELASNDYDLKKKYDFRKIRISREYKAGVSPVLCEESKIQQVFLNILKNAAQAVSEQENQDKTPEITLCVFEEKDMVRIEIKDNGPGMDEDTRKRVFEPFYTTKPVGIGNGLGMSVSYFIIKENHKGTIRVKSSPGNGACFIIRLPLKRREQNQE